MTIWAKLGAKVSRVIKHDYSSTVSILFNQNKTRPEQKNWQFNIISKITFRNHFKPQNQ